jgi:phosphoglycerate dehydrogenase-like enzyme
MPKVVFFTNMAANLADLIIQSAPADFEVEVHSAEQSDAVKSELAADADFMILFKPVRISGEVLRAAKKLKLIQLVSAGFDQIDLDLCQELGIQLANNGGTNSIDVAEHTLAMMLGFYRRMLEMDYNVRNDSWSGLDSGETTYTINGKTVGIIGLGNIGQRVARLLNAFGARVLFYDAYPPSAEVIAELGATQVELDDLLQQADIVTIHVPLMDETRGLIGSRELELMQPNAILINTCRGPVVNETALIDALRTGQIAGAALDVLEKEPPEPDNPILSLANVLLTPHTAGVTYDTWSRRGEFIFQNLQRVWDGQPPLAAIKLTS